MKIKDSDDLQWVTNKIHQLEAERECLASKHEPEEIEQEIDEIDSQIEGYKCDLADFYREADKELMEESKKW